jgi:8-oxo-dGTP pyrophosphatase MutT (NUDIX family)
MGCLIDARDSFGYTAMMKIGKVRSIAICVILREGKILVGEGFDEVKHERFGRPLGGTIEFGEYSQDTIVREIDEELGAEIRNLEYWGTLENIFTYNGQTGHEIVCVYRGDFADQRLYEQTVIEGNENGDPIRAVWVLLEDFELGKMPLYPTGLLEMIHRLQ